MRLTLDNAIVELGWGIRGLLYRLGFALVRWVSVGNPSGQTAVEDRGAVVTKCTEHVKCAGRREDTMSVVAVFDQ